MNAVATRLGQTIVNGYTPGTSEIKAVQGVAIMSLVFVSYNALLVGALLKGDKESAKCYASRIWPCVRAIGTIAVDLVPASIALAGTYLSVKGATSYFFS